MIVRFTAVIAVLVLAAGMLLTGCAKGPSGPTMKTTENVILAGYRMADQLDRNMDELLPPGARVIVTSFVNIDNLKQSSTLGRLLAEHTGSRLDQMGYDTRELKLRTDSIYIQEETGEFLLSRNLKLISRQHDAAAALVGAYGVAADTVYITARLVRTADGEVLSSCDHALVLYGPDREKLLLGSKR